MTVCRSYPAAIELLATAVRVAGPGSHGFAIPATRPLDAHRGTYTSFQEFLSIRQLGAEAEFNRLDVSNSSYWGFDKNRFVLARNTRYGQVRAFGIGAEQSDSAPGTSVCGRRQLLCVDSRSTLRGPAILKPAFQSAALAR